MTGTRVVRRLTADDWPVYRDVRLRALAADPRAFGSDLAREQAFDEPAWRLRAATATVAYCNEVAVGVIGWHWTDEPVRADLVAMWVDPVARGGGVGDALVRDVVDQVVTARGAALELGVVATNAPALALYRRAGFVETGREVGTHSGDLLVRMRHDDRDEVTER